MTIPRVLTPPKTPQVAFGALYTGGRTPIQSPIGRRSFSLATLYAWVGRPGDSTPRPFWTRAQQRTATGRIISLYLTMTLATASAIRSLIFTLHTMTDPRSRV